jgi:hypothetical protein
VALDGRDLELRRTDASATVASAVPAPNQASASTPTPLLTDHPPSGSSGSGAAWQPATRARATRSLGAAAEAAEVEQSVSQSGRPSDR